jgi:hypothetical protein
LSLCANVLGQSPESKKEIAVIELGGAMGQSLTGRGASFGGDLAVEVTPAEHWLELEAGVTPLFGRRSKEWNTDLVFGEPRSDSRQKASLVSCG